MLKLRNLFKAKLLVNSRSSIRIGSLVGVVYQIITLNSTSTKILKVKRFYQLILMEEYSNNLELLAEVVLKSLESTWWRWWTHQLGLLLLMHLNRLILSCFNLGKNGIYTNTRKKNNNILLLDKNMKIKLILLTRSQNLPLNIKVGLSQWTNLLR